MEKRQFELCVKVLSRLHTAGALQHLILIGSWCVPFYREYFTTPGFNPALRTRDMDFLVPFPSKITKKTDVAELLKSLGFIVGHTYPSGYIRLEHADLMVEFLVPEKGRGTDKPFLLPQLGVNAQAMRFLNLLADNTITVTVNDIPVRLPHPVHFALHKLVIAGRRKDKGKTEKDRAAGIQVLKALLRQGEGTAVHKGYASLPIKWKQAVAQSLAAADEKDMLPLCAGSKAFKSIA